MSLFGFLLLLLISAICGAVGQSLAGFSRGGCLVSIAIGFAGAWVGLWLAGALDLPKILEVKVDGKPFPIFWSIIGSILLALIFGAISRSSSRRPRS